MIKIFLFITLGGGLGAAFTAAYGRLNSARVLLALVAATLITKLSLSFSDSGVLPVFFPVDAVTIAVLGVTCCSLILATSASEPANRALIMDSGLLAGTLALLALNLPAPPSCFDYNHSYSYAVAFHLFRRLALAGALSASTVFACAWVRRRADDSQDSTRLTHQGRNLLLLAGISYLIAEDTGIVWCLKGWADVWRWSPGFMISSAILIFLMLVCHLPGGYRRSSDWYLGLGILSGPLLLLAQLIHN